MKRNANFYMANLGSEFLRAFRAWEVNDKESYAASRERCRSIINTLLSLKEMKKREMEINLLEEILNDFEHKKNRKYIITKKHIESYFNPFAMRIMSVTS